MKVNQGLELPGHKTGETPMHTWPFVVNQHV